MVPLTSSQKEYASTQFPPAPLFSYLDSVHCLLIANAMGEAGEGQTVYEAEWSLFLPSSVSRSLTFLFSLFFFPLAAK